jgi:uncharacterized protein (TIGR03118 family)
MRITRLIKSTAATILGLCCAFNMAHAQNTTNNYKQTNLVADTANVMPAPAHTDKNLLNPWGIAFFPNNPFWISDNNSGFTSLYDRNGLMQGSFVVPPPAGSNLPATPTGIVANLSATGFIVGGAPSLFIFDTEDGTISGWNGGANVILAVDNSMGGAGAVYKGLAMITNNGANFLLAANFRSGKVEVYNSNFMPANLPGNFTDANLPTGYAPFGIHVITGANSQVKIYVTYAVQDPPKHDPVHAAGDGIVDVFDDNGNMVQRLVSNGDMHTNAPWGVVIPPAGFGAFAGDVLVGNFGDGVLNAYTTGGTFIDSVRDAGGNVITNMSLWDLVFGGGGPAGDPKTLYLTAGGMAEMHGIFASLVPTQASGGNTPSFSVGVSPQSATVTAGQSTPPFSVTISPTNGFNSMLTFSCLGLPAGAKCRFSSPTYSFSGGAPTLTITTTPRMGMGAASLPGSSSGLRSGFRIVLVVGFYALFLAWLYIRGRRSSIGSAALVRKAGLVLLIAAVFAAAGCGGGNANTGTPQFHGPVMVQATSGTTTQTATITLTVN